MFVIGKREFFSLFKGIKSIIIVAILLVTAYYSAKFSDVLASVMEFTPDEMNYVHTIGLLSLLLLFGQLFVLGLSHDSINRETHERTMRFLVTRTSRLSILFGKFLGIVFFWTVCVAISFLIISVFAQHVDFFSFFQVMSLLIYQIAFTVLLSTVIPKPSITMFLGILIGIAFPIFGMWISFTTNEWVSWLKYVTPFYYLEHDNYLFLMIIPMAAIMLFISAVVFRRREF